MADNDPLCWVQRRPQTCLVQGCGKHADFEVTNAKQETTGPYCRSHANAICGLTQELAEYIAHEETTP